MHLGSLNIVGVYQLVLGSVVGRMLNLLPQMVGLRTYQHPCPTVSCTQTLKKEEHALH